LLRRAIIWRCGPLPSRTRNHARPVGIYPVSPPFGDPGDSSCPSFLIGADPWWVAAGSMAGRSPGRVRRPARAAIGRGGCERDKASARKDGNAAPARVPCRLSRLDLRRRGVCGTACAGRPRERLSPALTPGRLRRRRRS